MLQPIINLFFPAVCAGCNALLFSNETIIYTQCRRHEIPKKLILIGLSISFSNFISIYFVVKLLFF